MTTTHPGRGVVTLCDEAYFPGLLLLHESIQTSCPCPIVCYDAGLNQDQRRLAASLDDVLVLDIPNDPVVAGVIDATRDAQPLAKPNKRIWPLWICPLLLRAAPLRDMYWLDCDLVVLRGLEELFDFLDDGPVFTPENKAPEVTPNRPELYDYLPISRPFDPREPRVNGGVSGWRRGRDDDALQAYITPVKRAVMDPRIRAAISWHDQGALIWAIQSLGLQTRVLESNNWNMSVDSVPDDLKRLVTGETDLDTLRGLLPEVRILHWNGHRPPWLSAN
jgi:hypothetical protein